ncbi:MAG: hypothetical protein IBX56_09810, partial [Methylomicrobium sp.]|nr:hypothetical protein [Methylomicrobium sp.]
DFEQLTNEQRRKAGRSSPRAAGTPPVAGPVKFGGTGAGLAAWGIGDQLFNNPHVAQGREQAFANANRIIDEKFPNSDRKMFGVQFGTPGKPMPTPAMPGAPNNIAAQAEAGRAQLTLPQAPVNRPIPGADPVAEPKSSVRQGFGAVNPAPQPVVNPVANNEAATGNSNTGQRLNIHGEPLADPVILYKGNLKHGYRKEIANVDSVLPDSEYRQLLANQQGVTDDGGRFQSFGGFNPAYGADALENQQKALALDQQRLQQQALPAFGVNKAGELYQKDGEGAVEFNDKMAGRSMKNDTTQAWIDFYDDKTTEGQRSKIAEYLRENDPSGWLEHQKKRALF